MGCCGCSLAGSTVTAVVLGLLESIYGLSWNILVIVLMSQKSSNVTEENHFTTISSTALTEQADDDDILTASAYNWSAASSDDLWFKLSENIKSDLAVEENLFEIIIVALVLNSFWLITTLALAVGNAEKCRDMLKPWIFSTLTITVTDIAATVFFTFKAIKIGDEFDFKTSFFTNLYVFYAVMFSRGGIIVWIINIILCVYVIQRTQEIGSGKRKRPFNTDFNIMPYALSPPYDTFETESSTRTSKLNRPHTPPPDYEGKKRPPSSHSDPETLPLSVPGSRTSQRPISVNSYLYDDRVELQHRNSISAETVLHHAYVNKGLVMDADGWMGIPRPTLKSNHR